MNRRDIIRIGAFGSLSLPSLLQSQQSLTKKEPRAKSIIQIYLPGGVAHQDTWDYKIAGSPDYRGPFDGIKTKIAGVHFGALLKNTAAISNEITVINSVTHGEAAHERGTHNMLTGYRPSPALKYPSFGSVISHELGNRNKLPAYVIMPNVFAPENGTGYLSTEWGPFAIGSNPEDPNFAVKDLSPSKGIDQRIFDRRRSLLNSVDEYFATSDPVDSVKAMGSFYTQAFDLVTSKEAQAAFDLQKEPEYIKDSYGRNAAGQRLLMARRLVEAGVRMVTVTYGGWDHHSNLKGAMEANMINFDKAYAALIMDLKQRGLLDSTLVLISSEFGRTPKINNTNGRDHWPRVFSAVLAGGGIKAGYSYGKSDALAAEPEEDPVSPGQIAATIFDLLGVDIHKKLMTSDLRPVEIVYDADPIKQIMV